MNVVEVTGETVSKLSRLVKKAGEQQRAIVLELSKELGKHNLLIEKALDKESRLLQKVQRIEDYIMSKEMYRYEQIKEKLSAQKEAEKQKRAEQERKERERRQAQEQKNNSERNEESKLTQGPSDSARSQSPGRTGDAFKDFQLDLNKVESDEAVKYIKIGRESTYQFIDLLYRTDWKFEKKTPDGIKLYSLKTAGEPYSYVRFETKFGQVTVSELAEYFTDIDKRVAWEDVFNISLEQVKAYPMNTNMYYGKLTQKVGAFDSLFLSHRVQIQGNREYLSCVTVEHSDYPPQKKGKRANFTIHSNYFEPSTDGKGVKNILIAQMQQQPDEIDSSLSRSFSKQGINQVHLQSILNLKNLLKGTRQTAANTSYLKRTVVDVDTPNSATREITEEITPVYKTVKAAKIITNIKQAEDSTDKEKEPDIKTDEEEKEDTGIINPNGHLSQVQISEPIAEDEKEDEEEKQAGKKNRKKNKKGK